MASVPWWAWLIFGGAITTLIAIDLVFHRGERSDSYRASVLWSLAWVAAGLGFTAFVWRACGADHAQEYVAAYLIEKSLSVDNLFVFLVVFRSLRIPAESQRTVLMWGILGALFFRAIFIFAGASALQRFDWVSYVLGAVLILAAIRILREDPSEKQGNRLIGILSRRLPITNELSGHRFIVRIDGKVSVTPLMIALLALELTDITFAVDSVPAALSISRDPFIVYSSNAFAILGLRALYVVLVRMVEGLRYLRFGLGAVLAFAAAKLMLEEVVHIPAGISIAVIVVLLAAAIIPSVIRRRRDRREEEAELPA